MLYELDLVALLRRLLIVILGRCNNIRFCVHILFLEHYSTTLLFIVYDNGFSVRVFVVCRCIVDDTSGIVFARLLM